MFHRWVGALVWLALVGIAGPGNASLIGDHVDCFVSGDPAYSCVEASGGYVVEGIEFDVTVPRLTAIMDEILGDLYTNVSYHVESDHWSNYRNELMNGFKGYKKDSHEYDFKELRQAIYKNHKEEIVKDLNQLCV